MARLKEFALDTDPLIRELMPPAQQLGPTLRSVRLLAPDLRRLFVNLGPLISASKTGLPATAEVIRGLKPLLNQLGPFLEQLNPIFNWLALHQQLISDFIWNGAAPMSATTTSIGGNGRGHYLRQFQPLGPETASISSQRDPNNRGNTYPPPLWLAELFPGLPGKPINDWGLPAWDCNNTGGQHASTGNPPNGVQACWVERALPGKTSGPVPHLLQGSYPAR